MWTQSACHSEYDRTALDIALRKKEVILRALSCKEMDFAEAYSDYYSRRLTDAGNNEESLLLKRPERKGLLQQLKIECWLLKILPIRIWVKIFHKIYFVNLFAYNMHMCIDTPKGTPFLLVLLAIVEPYCNRKSISFKKSNTREWCVWSHTKRRG